MQNFFYILATFTWRVKWRSQTPLFCCHKYYKMPETTPVRETVASTRKNTLHLCSNNAVAKNHADFNLAVNMLHLIWRRFMLLFFRVSSCQHFFLMLPARKLRLRVLFVTQHVSAQCMEQKPLCATVLASWLFHTSPFSLLSSGQAVYISLKIEPSIKLRIILFSLLGCGCFNL